MFLLFSLLATSVFGAGESILSYGRSEAENKAQYEKFYKRPPQDQIAATVGQYHWVTFNDLEDWYHAEHCYPESHFQKKHSMLKALQIAVDMEILRLYYDGHKFSLQDLLEVEKSIDTATRAPDILGCIKNKFSGDIHRYWRVFILRYASGEPMRKFFVLDPRVQAKTFAAVDRVNELTEAGMSLKKISEELKAHISTHSFTYEERTLSKEDPKKGKKKKEGPPGPPGPGEWSPFEAQFIKDNLENMTIGQIKKPQDPRQDPQSEIEWMELVKIKGVKYTYATLKIRRSGIDEFMKDKPTIKVHISDKVDPEIDQYIHSLNPSGSVWELTCHKK